MGVLGRTSEDGESVRGDDTAAHQVGLAARLGKPSGAWESRARACMPA